MYPFKNLYTLDFSDVEYYTDVHKVIQKALDFPDYYGRNWDAFWDCLTDMIGRPVHIEIVGLEIIERKFGDTARKMIDILREFKHYDNDKYGGEIVIEVIRGKTKVALS